MPAFAQHSGRNVNRRPDSTSSSLEFEPAGRSRMLCDGANPPPYAAQGPGDPKHGAAVYGVYCSSCHGADGRGGKRASSIVDASYLALVSDQNLRTTVIVGTARIGRSRLAWRRARQADVAGGCLRCRGLACRAAAQFQASPIQVNCGERRNSMTT